MFLSLPLLSCGVALSNAALPRDQHNQSVLTGELDILEHPSDGHYYVYVNDWGVCPGIDCCGTPTGCASCCFRAITPPTCVETSNHSVIVYRTPDFDTWEYLGVALPAEARPAPRQIMYRPHVVYNARNSQFVLWYLTYVPSPRSFAYAVAVSEASTGPFRVINTNVTMATAAWKGDFDIFVDDDGTAYHVRTGFSIEELDANFTGVTGRSTQFSTPKTSEAPVFFKRRGVYYVLPNIECCSCHGGSNMFVFTAQGPLGPYAYQGDAGSNTSAPFDPFSPFNYPTRAQASAVVKLESQAGGEQFLWVGNQWDTSQAAGRPRNHDLLFFYPLEFDERANVRQVRYERTVHVRV